jgi:hypothetical protein
MKNNEEAKVKYNRCDCIKKIEEATLTSIRETLGADQIGEEDRANGFAHEMLIISGGHPNMIAMPFTFRYRRRKKNGDLEARFTDRSTNIAPNFCPFCGIKIKEELLKDSTNGTNN